MGKSLEGAVHHEQEHSGLIAEIGRRRQEPSALRKRITPHMTRIMTEETMTK